MFSVSISLILFSSLLAGTSHAQMFIEGKECAGLENEVKGAIVKMQGYADLGMKDSSSFWEGYYPYLTTVNSILTKMASHGCDTRIQTRKYFDYLGKYAQGIGVIHEYEEPSRKPAHSKKKPKKRK